MMSTLRSVAKLKCPRCRTGNLFLKKGWFRFKGTLDMHERCESCDLKYEMEPGFWLGSLWTSYPIIVLIELPFLIFAIYTDTVTMLWTFLIMAITMFLCFPMMHRLGRSIWIHICVLKKNE